MNRARSWSLVPLLAGIALISDGNCTPLPDELLQRLESCRPRALPGGEPDHQLPGLEPLGLFLGNRWLGDGTDLWPLERSLWGRKLPDPLSELKRPPRPIIGVIRIFPWGLAPQPGPDPDPDGPKPQFRPMLKPLSSFDRSAFEPGR